MGLIDRAILQDEIRQALNALFQNGQVPRIERTIEVIGSKTAAAYAESINISMTPDVTEGKLYRVTVNGIKEEIVAKKGEINSASVAYIGNLFLQNTNYEDTGEHFLIYTTSTRKHTCYATDPTTNDISVDRNITVELITETIHPIDLKFLPGVCLPVVELSTVVAINATFDDEESAALTAAFESGLPIAIKCNIDTGSFVFNNCGVLAMTTETNGIRGIAWELAETTIQIAFANGKWAVISAS